MKISFRVRFWKARLGRCSLILDLEKPQVKLHLLCCCLVRQKKVVNICIILQRTELLECNSAIKHRPIFSVFISVVAELLRKFRLRLETTHISESQISARLVSLLIFCSFFFWCVI
jgi:hypothetical protein